MGSGHRAVEEEALTQLAAEVAQERTQSDKASSPMTTRSVLATDPLHAAGVVEFRR